MRRSHSAQQMLALALMLGMDPSPNALARVDDEAEYNRTGRNPNLIRPQPKPYDHEAAARLRAERVTRYIANHKNRYPNLKGGGE